MISGRSREDETASKQQPMPRSRLGEHIDRLGSAAFGRCQDNRKIAENTASLRKVMLLFLLDISSA
jgi:hypothetical protein